MNIHVHCTCMYMYIHAQYMTRGTYSAVLYLILETQFHTRVKKLLPLCYTLLPLLISVLFILLLLLGHLILVGQDEV